MKTLLSLVVLFAATSFAEIKGPNSVTPSMCGQNEIKQVGSAVTSVCLATATIVLPTGHSSSGLGGLNGLTVTVVTGGKTQEYFYQAYTPSGLSVEPGVGSQGGVNRLKHYRLAGLVAGGKLVRSPFIALPSDATVVYTTTKGSSVSLAGKFLGLDFSTSKMHPVLTTM